MGEQMGEDNNVRDWLAPAYVEEVRNCLLPYAGVYGPAVERAVGYAVTGQGPEAVTQLREAVILFDEDLDDGRFLREVDATWNFRYAFPELTLLHATDDASVAFAARFLHAASPILGGVDNISPEDWALVVAGTYWSYRVKAPMAPYLAYLELLGLPEQFLLADTLGLRVSKDSLNQDVLEWPPFEDFDAYVRRHPRCWQEGLTHDNSRNVVRTFRMAKALGYGFPGLESAVFDRAISTRLDLRTEAQAFIASDPVRFEDRIREAPTHGHASSRAVAIELLERFLPPEEAISILETMRDDRSKKVQKRAQAALEILCPPDEIEDDKPTIDPLDIRIELDTPLHDDVRAAATSAYAFLKGQGVPSLDDTLRYLELGAGTPSPGWYDRWNGEDALRNLASLPNLTLVQYLRFLRWSGVLYRGSAEHLRLDSDAQWELSAFAKGRLQPPCLSEVLAAFRALGWQERGVATILAVGANVVDGWQVSRFLEFREDDLIEMWRKVETSLFGESSRDEVLPRLATFCASLPTLPDALMETLWEIALGNAITVRPHAQKALCNKVGVEARILEALKSKKQGVRAAAATWAADGQLTNAIPALHEALARERSLVARDSMLTAVDRLGGSIEPWISPERLRVHAEQGLQKGIPPKLSWFPFDSLPALEWKDGSPVDPASVCWLIVQAHALKAPAPGVQVRSVLSKLSEKSVHDLAAAVFRVWLIRDGAVKISVPVKQRSRARSAPADKGLFGTAAAVFRGLLGGDGAVQTSDTVEHAFQTGSATADKGLLGVVAAGADSDTIDQVRRYIETYYGTAQAQCFALLKMLSTIDLPDALLLLQRLARKFRTASIEWEAGQIIDEYAEARGWSKQELGDRTAPTGGLDESGRLSLSFGETKLSVELDPKSLLLVIRSANGKLRKGLPKPRVGDDDALVAQAKKQLRAARRQVKAVVADRKAAFFEAMCLERTWALPTWQQYLCAHPVMGPMCSRLVWQCDCDGKKKSFTRVEPSSFVDAHGAAFVPDADSTISLAHESTVPESIRTSWTARFEDQGIEPLFPQFGRTEAIRRVFPTYSGGLPDVKSLRVDAVLFYRRALSAGFTKGPIEDGPTICDFFFRLPSTDLVGVLTCSGIDLGLLNTIVNDIYEGLMGEAANVELEGLALCRGEGYDRESVDLETEAPPPLVVEIAASAAKAVGEELRLVRTAEG